MVDLVKIRKKKAKQREEALEVQEAATQPADARPPVSSPPSPESAEPPAPPAAETRPQPQTQTAAPSPVSKLDRFKSEAGKRRASESAAFAVEEATANQLELLTFVIAREQYAVDIERIVEIVTPRAFTRIPNADPSVVGIISLRGTIVTLLDVRRKLRHAGTSEASADTRVVVIEFGHEIVGFVVDRVLRVVKVGAGEIEPHPVVHAAELDDWVRGVFRVNGALTILLDLDKLLDHRALAGRTA